MAWFTAFAYAVTLGFVLYGIITFIGAQLIWFGKRRLGPIIGRPFIPLLTPVDGLVSAVIGWGVIAQAWFFFELGQVPMLLAGLALLIDLRQEGDPGLNHNARTLNRSEIMLLLIVLLGNVVRWLVYDHEIRWV